jgi:hypothetical protein
MDKPLELADTGDGAITFAINNHIRGVLAKSPIDTYVTRASSAGKCSRQLWFKKNGQLIDKVMEPRTQHLFRSGHISEVVLLNDMLESCVGPGKPFAELYCGEVDGEVEIGGVVYKTFKQLPWSFKLPNGEIVTAHPDAIARLHNGEWELIDAKTYSSFGFMKFENMDTPAIEAVEDYKYQAHALMGCDEAKELNINRFRFVGIRKDTSHLADRLIHFDQSILDFVIKNYIEALSEKMPDRAYAAEAEMEGRKPNKKPTGREILGWRCSYCAYTQSCWPNVQTEFKSGKPILIIDNNKGESDAV